MFFFSIFKYFTKFGSRGSLGPLVAFPDCFSTDWKSQLSSKASCKRALLAGTCL